MRTVTSAADITDTAVDSRVTRPRRGRQPGAGGAGSIKRFPQFPPGATAAAAKAARAGDVEDRRSVSLPVLSNNASNITSLVNDASVSPRFEVSGQHQPSPRDIREYRNHLLLCATFAISITNITMIKP